jgi:hypothetical protein
VNKMKKNMHRAKVIEVNMNIIWRGSWCHIYLQYTHINSSIKFGLYIPQRYYVDMPHSPPMTEDRVEENIIINLESFNQEQVKE